jgi:two-component system chemotaxis sensor kinase CheA
LDDLVSEFIAETREGLEALDSELVRFERSPDDPATLSNIFRLIHTIKGTCGFLGLPRLQALAHTAENVLGAFRDGALQVTPVAVSAVLDTVDVIRAITDALAEAGTEPEGDDSDLIVRLEGVLHGAGAAATNEPQAERQPVSLDGATSAEVAPDGRSLIERLGGDATLDAAVEMVLAKLPSRGELGALFADVDPDRLHGAIRDALCGIARKQEASGAFATALTELAAAPVDASVISAVFQMVSEAMGELDVRDVDIAVLADLACSKDAAEPAAAPAPGATLPDPDLALASALASPTIVEEARRETPLNPPAPAVAAPAMSRATNGESFEPAQTLRVSVDALEHLMTVVSELVLIRNQLIQTLRLEPESPFAAPLNRLNQVTSELQEGVMTTRMQPISGAWAKLPRLVRDLSQDLGKSIELVTSGQETELDRQVLELIKDPLTHMIRNAADHGLESPADRRAAGKPETGRINLQARHEGGAIVIEVADDGRGLSAEKIRAKAVATGLITPAQAEQMSDADARHLIFMAGFSTANEVTAVSGRGVGMDVVRTNIEKIGGAIEVTSQEGKGARFTIRIPLTLTIVSALIVECCGERFAMPQSSVVELVSATGASGRSIEYIHGAGVLRLRDRLLPLVSLQSLLGLEPAADAAAAETCIVVAQVGAFTFGVIVDRVFDTEEIVVKPVATILRHLKFYSGATILGDGSVILILDFKGISSETGAAQGGSVIQEEAAEALASSPQNRSALLVFRAADETPKAAPLASVSRIEEVGPEQIERVDGRTVLQYRGQLMPVVDVDAMPTKAWDGAERRPLLVFANEDQAVGLLVDEIIDIVANSVDSELSSSGEAASMGSLVIAGRATELIDVRFYWRKALGGDAPDGPRRTAGDAPAPPSARRLLLVDQSPFSQMLLRPLLSQAGYDVTVAGDHRAALTLHDDGARFDLIMMDMSPGGTPARELAHAFARAANWHETPVLELTLRDAGGEAAPGIREGKLLDAVSNAMGDFRGAA